MRHHNRILLPFILGSIFLFSITFAAETRGLSVIAKDSSSGRQGEVRLYNKSYAVIIGIDRYSNLPAGLQLQNAVKDAKGVEDVLRKNYRFDKIITLHNDQATKDRIMEVLTEELPAQMGRDDALFLFWAGHGNQEKSEYGEIGYLIPYDGSTDKIRKNITMAEIRDTVSKKIPAKHVFYVMDACYSGLLTTRTVDGKTRRDLSYLKEITKESARQVLTAGGKGEEALDGGPKGHSVFTGRLIEILENAPDFITANELQASIKEKVHSDASARNHVQTPGFGALYGLGDFVFIPKQQDRLGDLTGTSASRQKELEQLRKAEDEASAAKKHEQAEIAKKERVLAALDTKPPVIQITSPNVSRGLKLIAKDANITVIGKATDASGVAMVKVNGETAVLDADGNFSAEVLLKVGENRIVVAATNIHKNTATETFTLIRKAGQVAKAKPETTQLPTDINDGKYYALIIGNNNYRHLSRLQTAVNDATAIENILKVSYGFKTKLLLNATRKDILSSINEFRTKLSERDNLLIYYAGHGEFDRSAEKAYWLPVDALRDDPTDWIIAEDITSSIKRLSSKHVIIVSDSCYSGTLTRSAQTNLINKGEREEFLKKMSSRPSRTLIASGGNEPVADGGGSGHSIFADIFIKALRDIDTSIFTADELFYQYIKSRVAGRSDQVPDYSEIRNSGHDGGDFIFVKRK